MHLSRRPSARVVRSTAAFAGPTIRAALFLGFGLICGIWLFAGYYFTGRVADLEKRAAAVNERYMRAQELLTAARSQILLGSVYVRDALLDPNPATGDEYRRKLEEASRTAEEALQRYVPVVDAPTERERIVRLRREIGDFRTTVLEVLDTDSRSWIIEARTLIRSRIMPRREGVIRVAEEMQALNRGAFVQQQNEIAGLYRLTQRRLWASFGLAVFASLGIAVLAAIYAGRLEDRIQRQRHKERENARDLQRLSSQLLTAQEEERRTIARELHDEIGQALTALKVELAIAERAVEAAAGPVHALADARAIADAALHTVRDLSHLLHPALLDDLGLAAAVGGYLKGFGTRHELRAELLTDRMEERLAPETEAAAYRIVQEALTNVAKHARAGTCRVYLQRLTNTLLVTIEDDGVGFEPSELKVDGASRGLGLIGIRERVSQLRGTVRVESAPGRGTHLTVELPARPRPSDDAAPDVDSSHMTGLAAGGVSRG